MISIQQWIEALPKYQQGKGCLCSVDHKVCCLGALMIEDGCTFEEPEYPTQTQEGVPELVFRNYLGVSYTTTPPGIFITQYKLDTRVNDLPLAVRKQVMALLDNGAYGESSLAIALASINDNYQDDFASVITEQHCLCRQGD